MKQIRIIFIWTFQMGWHYTIANGVELTYLQAKDVLVRLEEVSRRDGYPYVVYEVEIPNYLLN